MVSDQPRILHVFKTASPISFGGVEDVISNITSTTSDQFNHTVLCTNPDKNFISLENHYKLISFKYNFCFSNNPISFGFHWYLYKYRKDYDIIHFHFPYPMMDFHFSKKIPYVITYHADLFRSKFITQPYRILAKKFLKHASRVIYTSHKYAAFSQFRKYATNIDVIPLTASELAESHLSNEYFDKNYFIYIGAFRKYKDLSTLIYAASKANIDLMLVGSGEMGDELKKLVEKKKIDKIKFCNALVDFEKFQMLSRARALVLPSNTESEAFGVVLLEAAALGKAIITADLNSGTTEVNEDNVTGLIFERSKVEQLSAILKKLQADDALCDKLGKNNREKYRNNYSRDLFGKRYSKLYSDVIQENRR